MKKKKTMQSNTQKSKDQTSRTSQQLWWTQEVRIA